MSLTDMDGAMPQHIYTAGDVEKLTGVSTVSQRERRLRGVFHYFGKQSETKRWHYDAKDLIGITLSKHLEGVVGDQFEAERMAHWTAPEIAKRIGLQDFRAVMVSNIRHPSDAGVYPDGPQDLGVCKRYALFARNSNPIITDNPTHVADFDGIAVVTLDLHKLSDLLPSDLVDRIKADDLAEAQTG